MNLVLDLAEITDADHNRVGGKGMALAKLQRTSWSVPQTFCLTTQAYELFVSQSSLRSVIRQELGRKQFTDMRWEELWDAALRIRNRFLRAPVPDQVLLALQEHLSLEFLRLPLAVRSSAPGEDSPEASFAGLHDSFVNVHGFEATVEAIRKVWASLWTDRALLYRRERGIDIDASAMAVVIQELLEGSSSGIAFGVHPTDSAAVAVEAVYGLNQGLVDGTIEPDRWRIDRRTQRVVDHVAPALRQRLVTLGTQIVVQDVPLEEASLPPLGEDDLSQVFAAVGAAGELFGTSQDMEWTLHDRRLVLLQSRPITTSTTAEDDKRAWYLSLTRTLHSLLGLRERVENELLPALEHEADEMAALDLLSLEISELAEEIDRRRRAHDKWVDIYTGEFIPLAHGIRLFGQFYNEMIHPEDPYEFMGLLAATPLMSVQRNLELARLASELRANPETRSRLEAGEHGEKDFEQQLGAFVRQYGDAAFASQRCLGDRSRLVRLLLTMAEAPLAPTSAAESDIEELAEVFLEKVGEERRPLARQLLDLGRASYRLRDDDNIYLARLENLVLDAVEEGRRRLREAEGRERRSDEWGKVVQALRHPNLVVEPRLADSPAGTERGFRAIPRQLVGQPAGPGVATGSARVVQQAEDLFQFEAGDVLVCDAVDPNMTFVVPMASAVVERRGGMLIHGAIIAREYGLPCVTGVPEAIEQITTGDHLTVDGYLGIVTVSRD